MSYDIKINPKHSGRFKKYCKEKLGSDEVTDECIEAGLKDEDPAVRKEANFARNSKKWKHGKSTKSTEKKEKKK